MPPIFKHELVVPESAIDENGHVNNVVYVQWMQDVAIMHYEESGCARLTAEIDATWVARSHNVVYLRPAFAGDRIVAITWVVDFRRVRSVRRYKFVRESDGETLVTGETEWIFVDMKTGRPRSMPQELQDLYVPLSDEAAVGL